MRKINQIVVHCSATRCDRPYTEADLTADHLQRGFSEAGIIKIGRASCRERVSNFV